MVSLKEAWELIETRVTPPPPQPVLLKEAWGCALAEDVQADVDVPGSASSLVDGVALRLSDLTGAGVWTIPLAGRLGEETLPSRRAARIGNQASLPQGADVVIPEEQVEFRGECVIIRERPRPGQFVRQRGAEVKRGELIHRRGTILKPADLGGLAATGRARALVHPRPRIALISIGESLAAPGEPLQPGQKYSVNDVTLPALLSRDHLTDVTLMPTISQEGSRAADEMRAALEKAIAVHPLTITNGGVSGGEDDLIMQAARDLNGEVIFQRVAVKPTNTSLLIRFGAESQPAWLLALPGNPLGVVTGHFLFARRIVARLMGMSYQPLQSIAYLAGGLTLGGDALKVVGVRLAQGGRGPIVEPSARPDPLHARSISAIDGFIYIPEGDQRLEAGAKITVDWL